MSMQSLFSNAPATAMRVRSGGFFDLANPRADDVRLSDIACGLARICRFGGQPEQFYSVAEHCVHAARHAQRYGYKLGFEQAVLMHDAAEAYVGDVIRPVRRMVPGFVDVERAVICAIIERFELPMGQFDSPALKEIDDGLLVAEYAELFGDGQPSPMFAATPFEFWGPQIAEREFLAMAEDLGIKD